MRRLKTGRRPPIYPKLTPGHLPCSSLTHPLPLPSRRPSVSFGGFGLTPKQRMDIYQEIMEFQSALNVKTFSIAIHKAKAHAKSWEARFAAWTFALQRLHRFCVAEDDRVAMFTDEGHGYFIRQRVRHMRRFHSIPNHFGPGVTDFKVERILEDPSDRRSQDSYLIQLADLNAYATHRSKYIERWSRLSEQRCPV